jgi:phosphoglycolate phosphatase
MSSLMAVGDTASDMQSGIRAGAGYCVGVLSGHDDEARLRTHGADEVVPSIVDLFGLGPLRPNTATRASH